MPDFCRPAWQILLAVLLCSAAFGADSPQPTSRSMRDGQAVREALDWLSAPPRFNAEYEFEMSVALRLIFFWIGKDGVGGGHIKMGHAAGDPNLEVIRVLFGSDPPKARGINRWGAGTEVVKRGADGTAQSSAFFGFMKSSQGKSVSAMEEDLAQEKQKGQHRFEAIISRVDTGRALSTTVPYYSDRDFDFRDVEPAEKMALQQVVEGQERKFRVLNGAMPGCNRSNGFLSTVQDLNTVALEKSETPVSLCYVYNSVAYTLTLKSVRPVAERVIQFKDSESKQTIERTYRDLQEARFNNLNHSTGKTTNFTLLLGTTGRLQGTPVQIRYQPNWWFRITLNLKPPAEEAARHR